MAQITAALVKELRERTGSGMMECKKALQATEGDIEAAIEHLRKTGQAKAETKAGRTAAEGLIMIRESTDGHTMAMLEVNCETDFVAKDGNFRAFVEAVADVILAQRPASLDELMVLPLNDGKSVDEARKDLIAKIGENVNVRRYTLVDTTSGVLNNYLHGHRIGVIVELATGTRELARDIAMHVAASRPLCVSADQVPEELIAKERDIYTVQAAETGKPAEIVTKMVEGRIRKYLEEVTLLGQNFVKNPDQKVEKLLQQENAKVAQFERFELGEGIEKKQENFAEEVMAQARGET